MIQSIIHETDNDNLYIYDNSNKLSMLIHPELKKAAEHSVYVNPYYLEKYNYLKKYGFFTQFKPNNFESLNESMVEKSIIQTKLIVFEVTDSCNLSCTYCGYGELYEVFDSRNDNKINIEYAISFLKYMYSLKLRNNEKELMIGFYGGEPLLNMNFVRDIICFLNDELNVSNDMIIKYSMTTNAVLLHKYVDFIVLNEFDLLISLDGNEENNSYRVFGNSDRSSFENVVNNIDYIKRVYPAYFKKNVSFNAVLHDKNSVKDIYEFIYNRYQKIPEISELNLKNVKNSKKKNIENMYHSRRASDLEYETYSTIPAMHYGSLIYDEMKEFVEHLSINCYTFNVTSLFYSEEKYFPSSTCLPFSLKIFYTVQNRLLPCERINHKYYLGEVHEEIHINIREITRRYNFYYDHLKKKCQNCYAYRFCGVCMFGIKNLDKIDVEEFICDRFYDYESFKNKLCRIFSYIEKYPNDFFAAINNLIVE